MGALHVEIDSSLDAVAGVGAAVRELCAREHVDETDAAMLELALVEAVTNAIVHAYGGRSDGRIVVDMRIDGGQIAAEVINGGAAADPERVAPKPEPDFSGPIDRASLAESGRGLSIIRGVFDEVVFSRVDDVNRLALRKTRGEPNR